MASNTPAPIDPTDMVPAVAHATGIAANAACVIAGTIIGLKKGHPVVGFIVGSTVGTVVLVGAALFAAMRQSKMVRVMPAPSSEPPIVEARV